MTGIDWTIVIVVYVGIVAVALHTQRRMQGVADFLAAGRSAGRYLLTISYGVAAVGAITVIGYFEAYERAGFALHWWEPITQGSILIAMLTGWVVYRFRRTRCLTLAEFFERRYSRRFRIFAGGCACISGLLNFAIFPAVGSRFFVHFCGLPAEFALAGITLDTALLVMILLLGTAVWLVFAGGQVSVLVTDFAQGVFSNIAFVALTVFLLWFVGWDAVSETLTDAPAGTSRINPLDTGDVENFGFTFFLIGAIGYFYSRMSWQGEQAYYTSARTAHEARMGAILSLWQLQVRLLFLVVVPVLAYVILQHHATADIATNVSTAMDGIDTDGVQNQMRVPLVLTHTLPAGLRGIMAAVMLAAFISTHNTYLHSWGSMLVQDIVLPVAQSTGWEPRRTTHLTLLRAGIVLVAVFAFFFSAFIYDPAQPVILYLALTGSLFVGWAGAVLIGGLYWSRGTTVAAWTAAAVGITITTASGLLSQMTNTYTSTGVPFWGWLDWMDAERIRYGADMVRRYLPDGQETWGLCMAACTVTYVAVSLLRPRPFDLTALLDRSADEEHDLHRTPRWWERALAITREFSVGDRRLAIATALYIGGWFVFVVITTLLALARPDHQPVSDATWLIFWRWRIGIATIVAGIVTVWLTIGGIRNLRALFRQLDEQARDDRDDGLVHHASRASESTRAS